MTVRDLVFRVSMAGRDEFMRDLASLNAMIRKGATEEVTIARAAAAGKRKVNDDERRHESAMLRTQLALEKARARDSVREADRAAKDKARAAERAEKDTTRAAQREQRERQREGDRIARDSIRRMDDERRAFERHEREKTRIALRETNVRQREAERAARDMARAADRESRDRMFDQKRLFRGIGMGVAGGIAGVARTGIGIGRSMMSATGFSDAWDIQGIMQQEMLAAKMMRSAAIEARGSGESFSFDEKGGLAKVRATALKFGISQRDLLGAIDAASEKGSAADAVTNLDRIAMQATAMGTDTTTIAKMRAQLKMSAKTAGKPLDDAAIDSMMASMHFVGKTGVFRAEDLASNAESLVSSFVKNGGDLATGWNRYMAFANEARKSTGSGDTARTSIMAVQDAIAKKESKINALGIKTRDSDGDRRDNIDVIMDVINKTGGQGKAFNQIFDPSRSGNAISTLMIANQAAGGGKSGMEAMRKLLQADVGSVAEMNKDAAARMDTPATSIAKSVELVRQKFAEVLEPVMKKFAENAPAFADALAKVANFAIDHPRLATLGVLGAGGGGGAVRPLLNAGLRGVGDLIGGKLGGTLTATGSTPVYVTGAAPGVMGSGTGGMPSIGGAGPGGMMGAALAGGPLAMTGGVAALTVAGAAAAGALFDLYRSTETYKKSLDEVAKVRVKNWDDLDTATKNGRGGIAEQIANDLDNIGTSETTTKKANVGKGFFGQGGKFTGKLQQTREELAGVGAIEKSMDAALGDATGTVQHDIRYSGAASANNAILSALGVSGPTSQLVGPAAAGVKDVAAAHDAESAKNLKDATADLKEAAKILADGARADRGVPGATPTSMFRMMRP